jgi:cyanuric acid amidohydrolase
MPDAIEVRKVPIHSVADASELAKLIDDGVMEADRVIAIIGKTEGNGGVNDYTRIIADRAFREVLVEKGAPADQVKQIPIVWSGGTDGVISPHATIFATVPAEDAVQTDEPRLTVGFAMSEQLLPEEIGRTPMITKVAAAVKEAMAKAGITDPADVHYVQTKTPLLTIHTSATPSRAASRSGPSTPTSRWTSPTASPRSASPSRSGEIEMPTDDDVMHNRELFSAWPPAPRASSSTRRRSSWSATRRASAAATAIGHSVMKDALDQDGIWDAIRSAGLDLPERPRTSDLDGRLVNVFLKCEASQDGTSAAAATRCSTTPTCTGTARSRPRRRRHRRRHRRPGRVRVGLGRPPGPRRRRPGRRDRRPL